MRPVRRADKLITFMCRPSRNSGSLNVKGLYEPEKEHFRNNSGSIQENKTDIFKTQYKTKLRF
jgi:hypothetical protein